MEYLGEKREKDSIMKGIAITSLLLVFIIVSSYLGLRYYRHFHVVAEVFSSFIAFSILMMVGNTYELSKNLPFLFLGIAFGFAGGFNVIHLLASNGVGFFQGDTTNLSMTLSIVQRYITAISILICFGLFYKSYKIVTTNTIILSFSVVSVILLLWIFLWGGFPNSYIAWYGSTPFKIASEYIISALTIISSIILFKGRKYIDSKVFFLLQLYFYVSILCNILLTFYTVQQEITNVTAHVLKVISYYLVYNAIVKVGLKTPYKLAFNELNQTVYELQQENKLRKSIEEMFLKNEASYKLLIENSRDTIIIYSQGKIVFANEGAVRLVGMDRPDKLLGKTVTVFFKFNSEETLKDTIAPAYETQVINIDGKTTPVEVTNAFITYNNKPAILSLIRDISPSKQIEKLKKDVETDRKLLNETLEFNRLITEFFSNISHELRTPLNVILSALQVLELEQLIDKKDRYIKTMKQNSYRLLKLINNLIDITRIDSGYVTPQMQDYNIVSVVEDITLSVAEYVEDKGIKFIFDTNVEEKVISCDPDNIERIMLNLISNAVKFTDKGDLISVVVLDQDDNVQISVKDTGVGIPEDKLQVIFERFRQADNSLSRDHEGSGIGLSLVKALVEMHGGSIDVKSSLGQGSEFIIKLPVRRIANTEVVEHNIFYKNSTEKISIEFSDI
jgi:PAS domain S-box-containing protein